MSPVWKALDMMLTGLFGGILMGDAELGSRP